MGTGWGLQCLQQQLGSGYNHPILHPVGQTPPDREERKIN